MTRDGLVEQNLATGEETRISQRGQDFSLKQDADNPAQRPVDTQGRATSHSRHQPQSQHMPEQQPDLRQNTPNDPAQTRFSEDTPTPDGNGDPVRRDIPDRPMEAARPTTRSYEARSHEEPAGPQSHSPKGQYQHQNTTSAQDSAGAYETQSGQPARPYSAENTQYTHQNTTVNAPDMSMSAQTPVSATTTPPGRLKFSEGQPQATPNTTPRQKGTKYSQRFNAEAAQSNDPATQPTGESGRLQYSHEQPQTPIDAAKQQHGTKYSQQFTPEAATTAQSPISETAKTTQLPVTDTPPPVKDGRLQFAADEKAPSQGDKLARLRNKADKTAQKLEKARDKLPTKKRIKTRRVYDEAKGKAKTKFEFEKEVIPQGYNKPTISARTGKAVGGAASMTVLNKVHQKISEVEHENVGVKAAHKIEQTGENIARTQRVTRSAFRFVKDRPYRKVAKLEKQAAKTNIKLTYQKALQDNPKLKSNLFSRIIQKQKIKRQYAKTVRDAQKAGKAVKKTGSVIGNAAKAVVNAVRSHPVVFGVIGLILFVFFFFGSLFSSCSNMAAGSLGAVFGTSYLAEDKDIDDAELAYTEWETDLQQQVNSAERDHPGYDEYRYNVEDIGHNPYELMAFLTSAYQNFRYSDVEAVLRQIFEQQYQLSFTPVTEIRYREETNTYTDPDTGETYTETEQVPYEWHVLEVNLTARSFSDIIIPRLTSEQQEIFNMLMQSKGNRQYAYSPFDFNWIPYVSCYYGWRVHPISGAKDYHKAVDIAVAQGTEIIAAHDGTITTASYDSGGYGNYLVLDDGKGLVTKYAHCSELLVSAGQQVKKGDIIAKVGSTGNSTGPHLHFEVIKNGQYLNPLYFAVTNDDGSGRLPPGSPGGPSYPGYPGAPLDDEKFAAMIAEGEKHLGKKYVFGASGPANFDCSGFVSWVLDKSGVHRMGRTNAQGLYNICTPVSPSNAKPGDLIFFSGTYSTPNAVSHVGIYVGNGMMLHCGNPIQYTSINTRYWQDHFYSFGRVN